MSSVYKILRFINTFCNEEVMTVLVHKGHAARESDFSANFRLKIGKCSITKLVL